MISRVDISKKRRLQKLCSKKDAKCDPSGNVRIGLEDSIYMPDGSLATNVAQVEKIVRITREIGREIATPEEAREILSLNSSHKDRILTKL